MHLRILCMAMGMLVAGCAAPSPYEPGKSTADIPAQIDVIKLDQVADINGWSSDPDWDKRIDPAPSDNDREVMALAKNAVVAQFENFGMHIVEDDSRAPDLKIKLYVAYQPEVLIAHRGVIVFIRVFDTEGSPILKMAKARMVTGGFIDGLVISVLTSRDGMVTDAARDAVQATVAELQKGTKPLARQPEPDSEAPHREAGVPSS